MDFFNKEYQDASEHNREELQKDIEKNSTLLGYVEFEDKLKEGVSETIRLIKEAGIKIWMMTGDNIPTSLTIAEKSHIVCKHWEQILIDHNVEKKITTGEALTKWFDKVSQFASGFYVKRLKRI